MKNNTMTLLELRDRCNELLASTSMPTYDTGIVSLGPSSGEMRIAVTTLCGELRQAEAEIDRLSISEEYWRNRCNEVESKLVRIGKVLAK